MTSGVIELIVGYHRFRDRYFVADRTLYEGLAQTGQSPLALVVGCCDSRVDPAILTDCRPGDLFVIRNVANLVPPCESGGLYHGTSAALEFGICDLEIPELIVLGHAQCGGIRAMVEGVKRPSSFISSWMQMAGDVCTRAREVENGRPFIRVCEQEAIRLSLSNLETFPWIRDRVERGMLTLHGWYFDLEAGELLRYDPQAGVFKSL